MSRLHPIISVTGSSGAGTTSVMRTFEQIFRREEINVAYIEGDSFHSYDRAEMKVKIAEAHDVGNHNFSHFGPDSNLFGELEELFRTYGETGTGTTTRRLSPTASRRAPSRRGRTFPTTPTCCSTKDCTARSSPAMWMSPGTRI